MIYPGLTFDEPSHTYRYQGKEVPSVTQLLDTALYNFAMVPEDLLQAAADRGTAVHLATELYDQDDLDESSLQPEWVPYLDAWKKFRAESGFEIDFIERKVFHPTLHYAGTIDRGGRMNKQRWLLDLKTTSTVSHAAGVQLAAYEKAARENDEIYKGTRKIHRGVVQLKNNGTYRLVPFKEESDWNTFVALLNIHNWKKNHGTA